MAHSGTHRKRDRSWSPFGTSLRPILLFGIYGGVLGDRRHRRSLLIITQATQFISVTVLAVCAALGAANLGVIYGVVLAQGMVDAIDNPVRRTFVRDLTTESELSNALSLFNSVAQVARAVGPAIGGAIIASLGVTWAFGLNAVTYLAALVAFLLIRKSELRPSQLLRRERGQIREGVSFAWGDHQIRGTLIVTFFAALFAWQWSVVLPAYAKSVFNGDAALFGLFVSVLSVGSLIGALSSARHAALGRKQMRTAAIGLTLGLVVLAIAPILGAALVGLVILGNSTSSYNIAAQSRLQLVTHSSMTSRVMSLYSVGFSGVKPLGGVIAGFVMDASGPRAAFAVGALGIASILALDGYVAIRARRKGSSPTSSPEIV